MNGKFIIWKLYISQNSLYNEKIYPIILENKKIRNPIIVASMEKGIKISK